MASLSDSKEKLDDGVKRASESPIPGKIQEVLQQFQERLSEKDVQITELQKKIENLQIGSTSGKSPLTRQPSKNSKENNLRPPTGKPAGATNIQRSGKHVRSATVATKSPIKSTTTETSTTTTTTTTNTSKSKSVPTSPSKKLPQNSKSTLSRPPSRQAVSSSEQPTKSRDTGVFSRTASMDRARVRKKSGTQLKKPPGKSVEINETSSKLKNTEKPPLDKGKSKTVESGKTLSLKFAHHDGGLTRSADSLSTHSADSQGSSAADFVSVSSGASPSPTAFMEGHPLNVDEVIPYSELALRLKRLTEEHEKLQAQHARLRLHLGSSMETSIDNITSSTESRILSELCSSNCASDFESDLSTTTDQRGQGDAREFCKEEVLRLRDELLVYQKQKCETEKRLDERFCRIQELLDERMKMNRELTDSSNRIDELIHKLDVAEKASKEKSAKIEQLEIVERNLKAEQHRLKCQLEAYESQNTNLRHQLEEKAKNLKYLERESSEMKEFMQAERLTLSEALSDTEMQLQRSTSRVAHLQAQLEVKSQSLQEVQSKNDMQRLELSELQMELESVKSASKDILLKQGAELSGTSVALSQMVHHLESIVLALTNQIETNRPTEKSAVNGHDNESSVVLPECDQQQVPRPEEVDKISLVNAVLKAVDSNDVVANGRSNPSEKSNDNNETSVEFELPSNGLRRDDSALSINSILSDGGDGQLLSCYGGFLGRDGKVSCILDQVKDVEGLLQQLGKLFKTLTSQHQSEVKVLKGSNNELRVDFERQLRVAECKLEGLQNRYMTAELAEQRLKTEMHTLQAKLKNTETMLQSSQVKYKDLVADYEKLSDQQIETAQLREQLKSLQSAKNVLEMEKKICMDQVTESLRKITELTCGGGSESESSLTEALNEKFALNRDIRKLKLQLCEKEEELSLLKSRFTKHTDVLQTNCKYADKEVLRLEALLNNVVQVLRDIPDVVANCESLQKLINHLQPN